jgi:hypothetical protein
MVGFARTSLGDGVTAQLVDDQIKLTAGTSIYLERETS